MNNVLITFPLEEALVTRLRGVSPKFNLTIAPASKIDDISSEQWEKTEILFTENILPPPGKSHKS